MAVEWLAMALFAAANVVIGGLIVVTVHALVKGKLLPVAAARA